MASRNVVGICGLTWLCGACTLLSGVGDLGTGPPDSSVPANVPGMGDGSTAPNDATDNGGGDAGLPDTSAPIDGAPPPPDASGPFNCNKPPSDPSLVAYYAFDDGAGQTVKDCSGHGHDGAIVGAPAWTTGKHGGALSFNGTNSCVNLGAASALQLTTLTITAWLNVADYNSSGVNGYVAGKTASNAGTLGWRFSTVASPNLFEAKVAVSTGGIGAFTVSSPGGQPIGTWMHVGLVLSSNRADIYVGGTRVANVSMPPGILEDAPASLRVGCNDGAKDYFKGMIDDLHIYSRALGNAEVAALAQ